MAHTRASLFSLPNSSSLGSEEDSLYSAHHLHIRLSSPRILHLLLPKIKITPKLPHNISGAYNPPQLKDTTPPTLIMSPLRVQMENLKRELEQLKKLREQQAENARETALFREETWATTAIVDKRLEKGGEDRGRGEEASGAFEAAGPGGVRGE
jgi:hypothetical protein